METIYIVAAVAGATGIITALAFMFVRQMADIPAPCADSDEWLYAEMNYLWWDDGIYWSARHV